MLSSVLPSLPSGDRFTLTKGLLNNKLIDFRTLPSEDRADICQVIFEQTLSSTLSICRHKTTVVRRSPEANYLHVARKYDMQIIHRPI